LISLAARRGRPAAGDRNMAVRKIWIEEGCISCNLCEDIAAEVFVVAAGDTCHTKKGHEKLLVGDSELDERIHEAADSCPVEVIQVEEG